MCLFSFSFFVRGQSPDGSSVWVLGRLTILNPKTQEPMIIKEQFGSSDIKKDKNGKELDYADDMKAAASDALKNLLHYLEFVLTYMLIQKQQAKLTKRQNRLETS